MTWTADDERREWAREFTACVAAIAGRLDLRELGLMGETNGGDPRLSGVRITKAAESLADEMAKVRARRFGAVETANTDAEALRAANDLAADLFYRISKYATEDRMRTPGVTRLARAIDESLVWLERHRAGKVQR